MEVTQSHGLTEGKTREKSKVSLLPVSPYYTTLGCTQTHCLVHTDPTLRRPLTNSGCTYASYFTSPVTPEVKAEWSSNLRAEWSSNLRAERSSDLRAEQGSDLRAERSSNLRAEQSSEMGAEWSSNSKSGAGQSSNLGVGWNLEQRKCEMGCPLTTTSRATGLTCYP